jgi:antitoxin MazE
MQVSKWGNSLAVRLPSSVVEALKLKAGDKIGIAASASRKFRVSKNRTPEQILESMRKLARPLPSGFRFDREEANRTKAPHVMVSDTRGDFRHSLFPPHTPATHL